VSTRRSSAVFGGAIVLGSLGQAAWLVAGARVFDGADFGIALTAQAMYGVLQIVVDNGAAFHGARLAARKGLDVAGRNELARARVTLALGGGLVGLLTASVGGWDLVRAFAPFAVALYLFALLNVWEPYGEGRMLPYAAFLVLRSLLLAVVIGAVALAGGSVPLELVGLCEVGAVVVAGAFFASWLVPRSGPRVRRSTWRSIFDIGSQGLIVQYNFSVLTIIFGVTGRTTAAAVSGVAFRLLSGLQSVNGIVVTAMFPQLAGATTPEERDSRMARLAAWGIVGVSAIALLCTAMSAPLLVRGFLDSASEAAQATLVVGVGAAAAAGLVMQQGFAFVAGGRERRLLRAVAPGAAVITIGGAVAAGIGGDASPIVAAAGFLVGQTLTLTLLMRSQAGPRPLDRGEWGLLATAGVALPALAALLAAVGELGPWIAAALLAGAALLFAARWKPLRDSGRLPSLRGRAG